MQTKTRNNEECKNWVDMGYPEYELTGVDKKCIIDKSFKTNKKMEEADCAKLLMNAIHSKTKKPLDIKKGF